MGLTTQSKRDAITISINELINKVLSNFVVKCIEIPIKPKDTQSAASPASYIVRFVLSKIESQILIKQI